MDLRNAVILPWLQTNVLGIFVFSSVSLMGLEGMAPGQGKAKSPSALISWVMWDGKSWQRKVVGASSSCCWFWSDGSIVWVLGRSWIQVMWSWCGCPWPAKSILWLLPGGVGGHYNTDTAGGAWPWASISQGLPLGFTLWLQWTSDSYLTNRKVGQVGRTRGMAENPVSDP